MTLSEEHQAVWAGAVGVHRGPDCAGLPAYNVQHRACVDVTGVGALGDSEQAFTAKCVSALCNGNVSASVVVFYVVAVAQPAPWACAAALCGGVV